MSVKTITVAYFRQHICAQLADLPDDTEIYFGQGDLDFSRVRNRGYRAHSNVPALMQVEFNQAYNIADPDPDH